jgi:hypothetical protein
MGISFDFGRAGFFNDGLFSRVESIVPVSDPQESLQDRINNSERLMKAVMATRKIMATEAPAIRTV